MKLIKISLAAARKNAHMTQDDAAEKLGVAKTTIVRWEQRPGDIKRCWHPMIAKCYRIPLENLDFFRP